MYRLTKHYKSLPSDILGIRSDRPKGFYLNRGVWLFGNMIESEMASAENAARKRHGKKKGNADKFIQSERLRVLGLHLREDIKRFRDPGKATHQINQDKNQNVDQQLGADFFQLKTK